ncbi:hypothetical protein BDQ17DRAFT_1535872 [Cyathus striatus]|nr:hypothetical protein BDQ17DRAFT_1535872 [Cyathus striatus]
MNPQQYASYTYYAQPQQPYPHTPAALPNHYMPIYGPPAHSGPPPTFDPAAYPSQPLQAPSVPRPNPHRRSNTTPARNNVPLKSALKKPAAAASAPEVPIARTRTNSFSRNNPSNIPRPLNIPSMSYGQDNRAPDTSVAALHMFISFHGFNELRLENITELALKELRTTIWPLWSDGIESDTVTNHACTVKFRNAPWDMNGPKAYESLRFIVELWTLCTRRGYSFQTTIDTSTPAPRLVFQVAQTDFKSTVFLAYFSQGGRRLTLINPPQPIDYTIGSKLRVVLGRKMTSNDLVDDNIRVIEVAKGNGFGGVVEPAHFLMHVLRIISEQHYELDAAVVLARRGPLGIRYRRELLVFKGPTQEE